jgi:hypothetical protein
MIWLIGAAMFTLLPVWRNATTNDGRDAWEHWQDTTSKAYLDQHIPVDDAVAEAQGAYCSCSRISRR